MQLFILQTLKSSFIYSHLYFPGWSLPCGPLCRLSSALSGTHLVGSKRPRPRRTRGTRPTHPLRPAHNKCNRRWLVACKPVYRSIGHPGPDSMPLSGQAESKATARIPYLAPPGAPTWYPGGDCQHCCWLIVFALPLPL